MLLPAPHPNRIDIYFGMMDVTQEKCMLVEHVPVISYPASQEAKFFNKKQSPKNPAAEGVKFQDENG